MNKKLHSTATIIAAILVTFLTSLSIAGTTLINPNGSDDTSQLQTALESCSGAKSKCKVILSEGIFYTDVLLVQNFNGKISGQGAGKTIIRPVTDRPLRSTDTVFQKDPTLAEPYPILLHFFDGGNIELSDFTLDFPAEMKVEPYVIFGAQDQVHDALISAIMAEGTTNPVQFSISGVEIIAAANDALFPFGSNLLNAIRFEGEHRAGITTPLSSGKFSAKDTHINGGGLGFALRDINGADAKIVNSSSINNRFISVFLTDMGDSKAKVFNNVLSSELEAVQIIRGFVDPAPSAASDFNIANNTVTVDSSNSLFGPGDGIVYADLTEEGGISDVVLKENSINMINEGLEGIYVFGDINKTRVKRNAVSGDAIDAGVTLDGSNGATTRENTFENLQPRLADVWLTNTTTNCDVKEPGATVLDEGTNNHVEN
jgi:hypothetical protein